MFKRRRRVIYVEPGKDPKQARIEYYQSLKRRSSGGDGALGLLLAGLAFAAVAVAGFWWWGSDNNTLFGKQPQASAVAELPSPIPITPTVTPTNTPSPAPIPITPTPTATPTEHAAKAKLLVQPLSPVLPTDTPRPPHPEERTPTATPTITNTPTPATEYTIIANEVIIDAERVYPVVSGWIVEADGVTPRPVAVELRYNGGSMRYPRPNNVDVANGHYEFLVSPGAFELVVLDGDYPAVPVVVSDNPQTRYEISFKYNKTRTVAAAISNPWNEAQAPIPVEAVYTSPIATPTPMIYRLYLPQILK